MKPIKHILVLMLVDGLLICVLGCVTVAGGSVGGRNAALVLCEDWKDVNGNGSPDPNEIIGAKSAFYVGEPITIVAFFRNMVGMKVYIGVLDLKNVPSPGPNGSAGAAVFAGADEIFHYPSDRLRTITSKNEALAFCIPAGTFFRPFFTFAGPPDAYFGVNRRRSGVSKDFRASRISFEGARDILADGSSRGDRRFRHQRPLRGFLRFRRGAGMKPKRSAKVKESHSFLIRDTMSVSDI